MYALGDSSNDLKLKGELSIRHPVCVVSFDLDNTIWQTSPTIAAANDALAEFVAEHTTSSTVRVEDVMSELFRADRTRYCPVRAAQTSNSTTSSKTGPVLLTQLRKDALRSIFGGTEDDEALVEKGFRLWCDTRHSVIRQYPASNVVASLQRLRQSCPHILMGAITDGNSDPTEVWDEVQWDFCVRSEDVGVGKPDARVYERAIEQVRQLQQRQAGDTTIDSPSTDDETADIAGRPWWIHVGDDFVKDIVAAKTMGMRSIWARELVLDQLRKKQAEQQQQQQVPPRDYEAFLRETAGQAVIQMKALGADDYLADGLEQDFADATVDTFVEVVDTIVQWHEEFLIEKETQLTQSKPAPTELADDGITMTVQDAGNPKKFCIHCGEKLPQQAQFCSSCGKKLAL